MTTNPRLRRLMARVKSTPLHPQWLLGDTSLVAQWVLKNASGTVLDVGCADRWLEKHLQATCRYLAVDYPPTGSQLYGAHPTVYANASSLPFRTASIDTVVLLEVLEHVDEPRQTLSSISRVLKSGGHLLLTMPFLYPIHDAPHDYQRYTLFGLTREIRAAGLVLEEVTPKLHAAETAGLIMCIALAGVSMRTVDKKSIALVLTPLLAGAIPIVNILAWVVGKLFPNWENVNAGYSLIARKP
jgi:SAM-dependent methyltransferase